MGRGKVGELRSLKIDIVAISFPRRLIAAAAAVVTLGRTRDEKIWEKTSKMKQQQRVG